MTLSLDFQKGLLKPVNYRPSPHCNERPPGSIVDLLVIHGISLPPKQFGTSAVEDFFCGVLDTSQHPYYLSLVDLRVSSHLFIKRTGDIIQFVPFHKRAWHAGESFFQGRTGCNDFSIGIELEGTDETPYEPFQYVQLSKVIRVLMQAYPGLTKQRIVGHQDIAPGRKTDPGPAFNWDYLKGMLL